jgi:hypothetical protein
MLIHDTPMSRATAARIRNIEGQHALDAQVPIGVIRGPSTARAAATPILTMSGGAVRTVRAAIHTARALDAPVARMIGTITTMSIENSGEAPFGNLSIHKYFSCRVVDRFGSI